MKTKIIGCAAALLMNISVVEAEQMPWRLGDELGAPDWLQLSAEHRTRYETLDQQFRKTVNGQPGTGGDQAIVFRTLAHVKVDLDVIRFGAEMMDSRIALADQGTASSSKALTNNIANPLELLQAYVELPMDDFLQEGSRSVLRAGRLTIDAGSRRLVARNRYRNTINSFTGAEWQWKAKGRKFQAFYTLPVRRLVDGDIRDNNPRFDSEYTQIRFWGMYYSQPLFSERDHAEGFVLGLNEKDTPDWQTRQREIYTYGLRFWRKPAVNAFDYQIETAYQLGESKASKTATKTLDHFSHKHHAELGYRFNSRWSPRLILQYDYVSGDDDPNDNKNNRFDTLYGGRRFDYGPTSIFGSFARSNISSPGIRLALKPQKQVSAMMSLRGFWRASTADAWTAAGINGSDSYIGTQIEARLRWQALPGNLHFESGVAHVFAGDLMDEAGKDDTTLTYVQSTFKF